MCTPGCEDHVYSNRIKKSNWSCVLIFAFFLLRAFILEACSVLQKDGWSHEQQKNYSVVTQQLIILIASRNVFCFQASEKFIFWGIDFSKWWILHFWKNCWVTPLSARSQTCSTFCIHFVCSNHICLPHYILSSFFLSYHLCILSTYCPFLYK